MNTSTFFLKINKSILNSFLAVLLIQTLSFGQQVSTYAGFGFGGMDGLLGTCAEFSGPNGIVTDNNGIVYVADTDNHSIRKIAIDGYVTTIAGNGTLGYADGIGSDARFNYPTGIAIDDLGNLLIADAGNNRIRKIASDGTVTTIAGDGQTGSDDGSINNASFNNPKGLVMNSLGDIFVVDSGNHRIRKITTDGMVITFAGGSSGNSDGQGAAASFSNPNSITIASNGNIYVTDSYNHKIRSIAPDGTVSTLAGSGIQGNNDGLGINASFSYPSGITTDNNYLYIADRDNHKIRLVSFSGQVSTIVNNNPGFNDGTTSLASFTVPTGLTIDANGNLLITDTGNSKIRKINPANIVSTIAGSGNNGFLDGVGTSASMYLPTGLFRDSAGNFYVTNPNTIRKIDANGTVITVAGNGQPGSSDGIGTNSSFTSLTALTVDPFGNIYALDAQFHHVRKIDPNGMVTTFAGSGIQGSDDGMGINASFNYPVDIISDQLGNLYIADYLNYKVRKITPDGNVTTFAGTGSYGNSDGPVESATFQAPTGLCADQFGNIFVLDGVNTIRKISTDLMVSTIPVNFITGGLFGNSNGFLQPNRITVDANGIIYVTDQYKVHRVLPDGRCTILAGDENNNNGGNPDLDGVRYNASFNVPYGIVCDPSGLIYVADEFNHKIRTITPCQTSESFNVTCNAPSIAGSCNGAAAVHSNGLATTMISIDGGPFAYTGNTNPYLFDQCPGVHDLRLVTECEDTLNTQYVIPLEANFIINNTFPDSVAIDTLGSTQINCEIDYTSIQDAYIDTAIYFNDTATVIWHIVDINGIHLDTATYIINDTNGVHWLQLSLFCPNRSQGDCFSVMETVNLSNGSLLLEVSDEIKNQPLISVYPNPSNDFLTIQTNSKFNTITIFDSSGKRIQALTMYQTETIDVSQWSDGIYILEVVSEKGKATRRLVKQ